MGCMKCGRDVDAGQVFCTQCLLDMEKYPVRPGTVVQLPIRQETPLIRKLPVKRRVISPEEQVRTLRRRLRIAVLLLVLMASFLLVLVKPAVEHLLEDYRHRPGQNYSTFTLPTDGAEPRSE